MATRRRQRGMAVVLAALVLLVAAGLFLASALTGLAFVPERDAASDRAIAQAREALIAYAADRPIDAAVGPGYLPCPDRDDDGWAEATCGSLSGDSGQGQRLGRLPWKTLGLPDVRDGHGERLWYAVSSKHKGLLNCAASRGCVDMSPPVALGTISVRDAAGTLLHDGTQSDPGLAERGGAAAVVLAPGPPLERRSGPVLEQKRECLPGECDANGYCVREEAAHCIAANFLDASPAEDNAAFRDRNDAAGRAGNRDGFIAGPVTDGAGRPVVNDRLAAIGYADLMPRVMARVALEAALCLRAQAARTAGGRYPQPEPACGTTAPYGRLPEFAAPGLEGCNLAASIPQPAWWTTWQAHVLYAPAAAFLPGGNGSCEAPGGCLEAIDSQGRVVARDKRFALVVTRRANECGSERLRCDARTCRQVVLGDGIDVARAFP